MVEFDDKSEPTKDKRCVSPRRGLMWELLAFIIF